MRLLVWFGSFSSVFLAAQAALAIPIDGEFNMAGSFEITGEALDFHPSAGTSGTFVTLQGGTGYFSTIASTNLATPYLGTIKDLTATSSDVTEFLSGFTAPGYAGLTVDLDEIVTPSAAPCTGAEAANTSCRETIEPVGRKHKHDERIQGKEFFVRVPV